MIERDCTILFSLLSSDAVSKGKHTLTVNESGIELWGKKKGKLRFLEKLLLILREQS